MRHLPNIEVKVLPHKQQRYETVGDYLYINHKLLNVRISELEPDEEFLIMIHELIEWYLNEREGITIGEVDKFDKAFEKKRKKGNTDEPGDCPQAPYHENHKYATIIEKILAWRLKVDWDEYNNHVNKL